MTNHLASADSLSSYTWDSLMEDLKARGLFADHLSHLVSVTGNAGEERRRYHGSRATKVIIERYAEDSRQHFALLVQTLRQTPETLTADDILNRPQHWLTAWAIAAKLEGKP